MTLQLGQDLSFEMLTRQTLENTHALPEMYSIRKETEKKQTYSSIISKVYFKVYLSKSLKIRHDYCVVGRFSDFIDEL